MRTIMVLAMVLLIAPFASAVPITASFEIVVDTPDSLFPSPPFSSGDTVSGSLSYETDPLFNPDTSPAFDVGNYTLDTFVLGGVSATSLGIRVLDNNTTDPILPPGGDFLLFDGQIGGVSFTLALADLSGGLFPDDTLPSLPQLSDFADGGLIFIVGEGGHDVTSFDSTPIPEPTTLLAMGIGILAFAGYANRRRLRKRA